MGLLALWALLGPWLVDASPIEQNLSNQLAHPGAAHWLGTDVLGRSWLARLAHATQLSLGMAVLAALSAAVPGTLLGVLAAWRGGRVARTLVMLADAVLAIPGLLLVLLGVAFSIRDPKVWLSRAVVLAVVVLGIASVLVVSVVQKQREIGILRAMGATRGQVLRLFLVQGAVVGAVGSALGLLLAVALIWVFTAFVRGSDGLPLFSIALPLETAWRVALIATACGVLAAVVPARRAAQPPAGARPAGRAGHG